MCFCIRWITLEKPKLVWSSHVESHKLICAHARFPTLAGGEQDVANEMVIGGFGGCVNSKPVKI
jgi:hypothetical protein